MAFNIQVFKQIRNRQYTKLSIQLNRITQLLKYLSQTTNVLYYKTYKHP